MTPSLDGDHHLNAVLSATEGVEQPGRRIKIRPLRVVDGDERRTGGQPVESLVNVFDNLVDVIRTLLKELKKVFEARHLPDDLTK